MKYKVECIYYDKVNYDKEIQVVGTFKELDLGIQFFIKQENWGSKGEVKYMHIDIVN